MIGRVLASVVIAALAACSPDAKLAAASHAEPQAAAERSSPPPQRAARSASSAADWCVSGGAPLVGAPLVDLKDRLYFATVDGTLHAFEKDGRYRFGFTLQGTPLGSAALRPEDGSILLGTSRKLVYAISQAGLLRWSFNALSPVWSGIVPLGADKVLFVGLDRRLYALSTTGAALYRVTLPGEPAGEPLVGPTGSVWVPLADGLVRVEGARIATKLALGAAVETLVLDGAGVAARVGRQVSLLDAAGEVSARVEADEVGGGPGGLALVVGNRLQWRSGSDATHFELQLPGPVSAPPLTGPDFVALPLADGQLLVVRAKGQARTLRIGNAALGRPVLGPTQLFVPTADGQICAFGGWTASP